MLLFQNFKSDSVRILSALKRLLKGTHFLEEKGQVVVWDSHIDGVLAFDFGCDL